MFGRALRQPSYRSEGKIMTSENKIDDGAPNEKNHSTAWLSYGLEELISRLSIRQEKYYDFDVVIVGSGYGGAVAANELAGRTDASGKAISLCILERGSEYLPGMFPSRMAEMAGHIRCSTPGSSTAVGRREGLWDVRIGQDLCAIVANGLGGGSLINAGVMEEPVDRVFEGWPSGLRYSGDRDKYFKRAKEMLGASAKGDQGELANTILLHPDGVPAKYEALLGMSEYEGRPPSRPTSLTVAMDDKCNLSDVKLNKCILCGDCATGCNHGAKESLDTNLLVNAWRNGAQIVTGATVHKIRRCDTGRAWCIDVFHTEEKLRKRQGAAFQLRAGKVILSAGTFGSTEILLRSSSSSNDLKLSRQLGQRFSSNGDAIFVAYDQKAEVNAVANETVPGAMRKVGPTNTAMIDWRAYPDTDNGGAVIQELAVPGPVRRLFEEIWTTAASLDSLPNSDTTNHKPDWRGVDPCAVNEAAIKRSSVLAIMGDDDADGALELVGDDSETHGDGAIKVRWPELRDKKVFSQQKHLLERLVIKGVIGGRILPNPAWQVLPESMKFLMDNKKGPPITVHPLGGCPMGTNLNEGVVDEYGRVFDASFLEKGKTDGLHEGLVVLDGSIIPVALGINPALTIAAVSLRAIEKLCQDWGYTSKPAVEREILARPVFSQPKTPPHSRSTRVEIMERMSGQAKLGFGSEPPIPCAIELTLKFKPIGISSLMGDMQRELEVSPDSTLRVFRLQDWNELRGGKAEDEIKQRAIVTTNLRGTLRFLHQEKSTSVERQGRALAAWFRNRGLRDILQRLLEARQKKETIFTKHNLHEWKKRLRVICALATKAGEVRLFDYTLQVVDPVIQNPNLLAGSGKDWSGAQIRGTKRLTYNRRANPWRQLKEIYISEFPGLVSEKPTLTLDTRFFAEQRTPLLRIVEQEDQPSALADLMSFALYFLRVLVRVHFWSFRRPDAFETREPQRLPGFIPCLPSPEVKELEVDKLPSGFPVNVRLTRYTNTHSAKVPVVLIHGYSTSGTTFTHVAIKPNMAQFLHERQRDVWVLDLRTSSGMPTARYPWTFEDAALADIPAAFDYILRETRAKELDVVAHCMGAAMFSMAVLAPPKAGERFFRERERLPSGIRKAVLSQAGPVMIFKPDNVFRSYLVSYLRYFLPIVMYDFQIPTNPSLVDQLLDRFLATLPYSVKEFDIENPLWGKTPFVGTRRRLDAFYGQTFKLENLTEDVLDNINDLFGPSSIKTISQAMHFSRLQQITNRNGRNVFVKRENLQNRWKFPTLGLHSEENGLFDIATMARMQAVFHDAGIYFEPKPFSGLGHQDTLIGKQAENVFEVINDFLESEHHPATEPSRELLVRLPTLGPLIGPLHLRNGQITHIPIAAGTDPAFGRPLAAGFIPLVLHPDDASKFCVLNDNAEKIDSDRQLVRWLMPIPDDPDGWVRVYPSAKLWPTNAEGVLLVLFYNQPSILGSTSYSLTKQRINTNLSGKLAKFQFLSSAAPAVDPSDSQHLESDIHKFVEANEGRLWKALNDLLSDNNVSDLTESLIPLPVSVQKQRERGSEETRELTFALASCQYPAGIFDSEVAFASYNSLLEKVRIADRPDLEFLLLAGDQVYVDATAGLFDPTVLDDRYQGAYEKLFSIKSFRSLIRRIPTYMILDDHEITDDWEPGNDDLRVDPLMKKGREAYWKFERPEALSRPKPDGDSVYPLWSHLNLSGFPFFMADTRTERTKRSANIKRARIMRKAQFKTLLSWLKKQDADCPKFIASSSIFLPRKLRAIGKTDYPPCALKSDAWDGFPGSLYHLLGEIARNRINNVIFLSGDEHLSCIAQARVCPSNGTPVVIHSIHSSALYAPFPFANSIPDDFADTETFTFPVWGGARYTCDVSTKFVPSGDGFAILNVEKKSDRWEVKVEFNQRGSGTCTHLICGSCDFI